MAEAWPLAWPAGIERTKNPQQSRFDSSFVQSRDGIFEEVRRIGGRYPVLSTNIELKRDGRPYANQPEPRDAGVACYFERKGKQMVFACDRWNRVKDNMRAIQKTIEAIRGIERWGASEMLERAFSAFEALPPPQANRERGWREILGIHPTAHVGKEEINHFYREAAQKAHPDMGGSNEAMAEINAARAIALKEMAL